MFITGDVVQQIDFGTIMSVNSEPLDGQVECLWVSNDGILKRGLFSLYELVPFTSDSLFSEEF